MAEKGDSFEMKFRGGPCDGGIFRLPHCQVDVGYPLEWVVQVDSDGIMHTYESEGALLESTVEVAMNYRGGSDDMGWKLFFP